MRIVVNECVLCANVVVLFLSSGDFLLPYIRSACAPTTRHHLAGSGARPLSLARQQQRKKPSCIILL